MRIDRVRFITAMARNELTVNELAQRSGVSRVTISAVRGGKSCADETAKKLANVLGKSILKED